MGYMFNTPSAPASHPPSASTTSLCHLPQQRHWALLKVVNRVENRIAADVVDDGCLLQQIRGISIHLHIIIIAHTVMMMMMMYAHVCVRERS